MRKFCFQKNAVMFDLFDVQGGMIVKGRLAGAFVSRSANLMDISRSNVPRIMAPYIKLGKVFSAKQISRRKSKLTDRDK